MDGHWTLGIVAVLVIAFVLIARPEWYMALLGLLIWLPLIAIALLTVGVWIARKLRI